MRIAGHDRRSTGPRYRAADGLARRATRVRHRRGIGHRRGDVPAHGGRRRARRGRRHRRAARARQWRNRSTASRTASTSPTSTRSRARRTTRTSRLGGLTVLFNNAGGSSMAAVHDYALDEWQRIVTLNLTGVFHGFKAVAPLIVQVGRRRDRVDRVDLGDSARRRRGALRGREGRRRRAHRDRRARVRADDARERGVARHDRTRR